MILVNTSCRDLRARDPTWPVDNSGAFSFDGAMWFSPAPTRPSGARGPSRNHPHTTPVPDRPTHNRTTTDVQERQLGRKKGCSHRKGWRRPTPVRMVDLPRPTIWGAPLDAPLLPPVNYSPKSSLKCSLTMSTLASTSISPGSLSLSGFAGSQREGL